MSTDSLHSMGIPELRQEQRLAKVRLEDIKRSSRGTTLGERMELEEAAQEAREYIDIIEARIARLERVGRN